MRGDKARLLAKPEPFFFFFFAMLWVLQMSDQSGQRHAENARKTRQFARRLHSMSHPKHRSVGIYQVNGMDER